MPHDYSESELEELKAEFEGFNFQDYLEMKEAFQKQRATNREIRRQVKSHEELFIEFKELIYILLNSETFPQILNLAVNKNPISVAYFVMMNKGRIIKEVENIKFIDRVLNINKMMVEFKNLLTQEELNLLTGNNEDNANS